MKSRRRSIPVSLIAVVCALGCASSAKAQATTSGLPDRFRDVTEFSGLTDPAAVRFAAFPDSRIFVAEKSGIIKAFDGLGDSTPTVVADLSTQVHNYWDRGLLGLAVDPGFPTRPYLYVAYTYDAAIGGTAPRWGDACPNPPGPTTNGCVVSGRLAKLTIDPTSNVMTREQVLVNDWCQQFPSHSVGDVRFGPDGALYMSGGEGASFNYADYGQTGNPCNDPPGGAMTLPTAEGGALRSQSLRRPSGEPVLLSGSVIRVDPDTGLGKPDNPLASSPSANARRIVAFGLRNPFRFTFRPGTNELWVGNVGWTNVEEIERQVNPKASTQNGGWPCYEGGSRLASFSTANLCSGLANTPPYYSYGRTSLSSADFCPATNSKALTGLAFYAGGDYPSSYNGALFIADHSRPCIWVARAGANGVPDMSTIASFYTSPSFHPVDLQAGPGGDLFYVDMENGTINRIDYTSDNQPPTARITSDKTSGDPPLTVSFDARGSSDPDAGDALSYSWDLNGDGTYGDSTSATPSFTFQQPGGHRVGLKVTDRAGASDTATLTISVSPPTATIDSPTSTFAWKVGDPINFSGHATDKQDGTLTGSALSWRVILHHCPADISSCHTHVVQDFDRVASGLFSAPDHEYPSYIELRLTATDSTGLTDTKSVRLDPQTKTLDFNTSPSGLGLTVNGTSKPTPFSQTVISGSSNSLSAPTPQLLSGSYYEFSSWSDGGPVSHNITAGSTGGYTATYRLLPRVAYRDVVLGSSGLLSYWRLGEGSGTVARDEKGLTNGTYAGGPALGQAGALAGDPDKAVGFDGVNDEMNVGASRLSLAAAGTLEGWFLWEAGAALMRDHTASSGWILAYDSGGKLAYRVSGTSFVTGRSTASVKGGWHHFAVTVGAGAAALYVDGELVHSGTVGTVRAAVMPWHVMLNGTYTNQWAKGRADEVAVYDSRLPAADIKAHYQRGAG